MSEVNPATVEFASEFVRQTSRLSSAIMDDFMAVA
jgi:hypothetical protein